MSNGVAALDAGVGERIGPSSRIGVGVAVNLATEVGVFAAFGVGDCTSAVGVGIDVGDVVISIVGVNVRAKAGVGLRVSSVVLDGGTGSTVAVSGSLPPQPLRTKVLTITPRNRNERLAKKN